MKKQLREELIRGRQRKQINSGGTGKGGGGWYRTEWKSVLKGAANAWRQSTMMVDDDHHVVDDEESRVRGWWLIQAGQEPPGLRATHSACCQW